MRNGRPGGPPLHRAFGCVGNGAGALALAAGEEKVMAKQPKAGDKVKWSSAQGEVKGTVVRKVTSETKVKGHVAKATSAEPQYVVKSERTGAEAVHRAGALRKG